MHELDIYYILYSLYIYQYNNNNIYICICNNFRFSFPFYRWASGSESFCYHNSHSKFDICITKLPNQRNLCSQLAHNSQFPLDKIIVIHTQRICIIIWFKYINLVKPWNETSKCIQWRHGIDIFSDKSSFKLNFISSRLMDFCSNSYSNKRDWLQHHQCYFRILMEIFIAFQHKYS